MTIFHLLLVIYHRLEPQPTHRTTINGTETRRDNFRNFDRLVQHDKIDFLMKIARLNTILAIGHLRQKANRSERKRKKGKRNKKREENRKSNEKPEIT